ncbi:hypothetical protein ID866_6001, partial [Astraeus odoratus]
MGLFAGMLYCSTPAIVSHWCAITTFVWPFTTSKIAPLVVVSTIYGIGMALTSMTFGAAAGPPLAGVIRTKTGSYED